MSYVYETVTQSVIADLEKGVASWVKPWAGGGLAELPYNATTRRPYSGVNVLLLWSGALCSGYTSPAWLTFLQAKKLGGRLHKGKGTHIAFAKRYTKDAGGEEERELSFLKFHTVFNVAQVDGLPKEFYNIPEPRPLEEALLGAEEFVKGLGADVRHGCDRAAYSPSLDCIHLPHRESFYTAEGYFCTSLHEHAHWSGHASRLNRDLTGRFGTEAYAAEELVAELTAAFLCAGLGIRGELRHSEYIGSWLKLLEDKRAIFTAAGKATQAAEYLRSLNDPKQAIDVGTPAMATA